jgi:hypothetical protein
MTVHVVAGERLKRGLRRSADEAELVMCEVSEVSKPWHSCSFVGGLHEVRFTMVAGESARAWIGGLDEYEVSVPGFVLASLEASSVVEADGRFDITVDALTIAEA